MAALLGGGQLVLEVHAGGASLDTQGNQLYDTPRNLFSAGIGYDNQTVRDLFAEADTELTDDAANADYQQALEQIATDAPVVWLWSFPNLIVADADVQGIVQNQISAAFELATISQG